MLRSVYSGITGMRIHQMWFDVIAGNMANVNTTGYKKSRISFEDLLNQTFKGAMQPRGELGGTNPMQVGLGGSVASIQVIHTQGTVKETQNTTDLLIDGEGYFVVSDGSGENKYTRAGNLGFDDAGNLVNLSNGFKVLGWNAQRDEKTGLLIIDAEKKTMIDTSAPLEGIKIRDDDIMSPKATTSVSFAGNLNASTEIAFDPADLNLVKYIKSVVPVSKAGTGISLNVSWEEAGFENTPTGTITIGPEGYTQTFTLGSKPQDLIDAINDNSETTGVSIEYTEDDKFVLKTDPNNTRVKEAGGRIVIAETPAEGKTGFFTEAKIPTRTYHASMDIEISFERILDPSNPNNIYFRWKAVDPSTEELISTNAYYYVEDDYGVDPGQVTGELLGYSAVTAQDITFPGRLGTVGDETTVSVIRPLVLELDNADVDSTSLQIYVEDPDTGTKRLYKPYKLPGVRPDEGVAYNFPDEYIEGLDNIRGAEDVAYVYYFDDNGEMEWFWDPTVLQNLPAAPTRADIEVCKNRIGKSENGVDRIILWTYDSTKPANERFGVPKTGSKITADYSRNGFNLSSSTVDPTTLQMKINGETQEKTLYKFNSNLGVGGADQITFYSTVSTEDVVADVLDTSKAFDKAGFNSGLPEIIMSNAALDSKLGIAWNGGNDFWVSAELSSYATVADFLAAVTAGVNGAAGTNIINFYYNSTEDRFKLENTQGIYIWQTNDEGFLSHAKLPGEGRELTDDNPDVDTITREAIYLAAYENPESREEVVANRIDLTKPFAKAGFNGGFRDITHPGGVEGAECESYIIFSWTTDDGYNVKWDSETLDTYTSVEEFLMDVSQAVAPEDSRNVDENGNPIFQDQEGEGAPLPVTIRYDEANDRFVIICTNSTVKVEQTTTNGFLTKAKLLTTGLEAVKVPVSPYDKDDVVTADYNYNKSVDARGMLQLNSDYKVINNFKDTESVPEITSSIEVIDGPESVNLAGGWNQFDSGTVNGTVSISTDSGTYTSKEINLSNYPTVQSLLNEINASDAEVQIEYDPTTDKFTIKSKTEGARITLSENGTTPFFSEINISVGTVEGGNNNGVMDLSNERPDPEDGWADTTKASGTGRDFFRVNVVENEVKDEKLGTAGSGKPGTHVMKLDLGSISANISGDSPPMEPHDVTDYYVLSAPNAEIGGWKLTLGHGDVDAETISIYRYDWENEEITARIDNEYIKFYDNTGPGGEDQIFIPTVGANAWTGGSEDDGLLVDYTRLNAFDLKNPDADPTTLVLKVNDVIQSEEDYTFLDGAGANGVDRIILDRSYGTGEVMVDYRQVEPLSCDVFIPNGNEGPESLTFTPNTSIDTTYPGYKTSDEGVAVTTEQNEDYIYRASKKLYDAIGTAWDVTFRFEKLSVNRWLWTVMNPASDDDIFSGYGILVFDDDGDYDEEKSKVFESPSDIKESGAKFKGVLFDPGNGEGAAVVQVNIDFSKIHQYEAETSDAEIETQDGYAKGVLAEKTINSQGVIVGSYTNGQVQELAQIALATFANPAGLAKESNTLFAETLNSGEANIGTPGDGKGVIQSGQLEMSNVDLVEEFTDLIIAQRAFQANSRVIVTDDQILTEIVNLKR